MPDTGYRYLLQEVVSPSSSSSQLQVSAFGVLVSECLVFVIIIYNVSIIECRIIIMWHLSASASVLSPGF